MGFSRRLTTPPDCPADGTRSFLDKHTFADGSVDFFDNDPPCKPA